MIAYPKITQDLRQEIKDLFMQGRPKKNLQNIDLKKQSPKISQLSSLRTSYFSSISEQDTDSVPEQEIKGKNETGSTNGRLKDSRNLQNLPDY